MVGNNFRVAIHGELCIQKKIFSNIWNLLPHPKRSQYRNPLPRMAWGSTYAKILPLIYVYIYIYFYFGRKVCYSLELVNVQLYTKIGLEEKKIFGPLDLVTFRFYYMQEVMELGWVIQPTTTYYFSKHSFCNWCIDSNSTLLNF